MKKTLILITLLASMMAHGQTIANLKIGQTKTSVESTYGMPDEKETSEWVYHFGKHLSIYVKFKNNTVARISASGDEDKQGIFKSRLGIVLGDTDSKLVKAYGSGKLSVACAVMFTRTFSNIMFTCYGRPGVATVVGIDVFPPSKPVIKKTVAKKPPVKKTSKK